MAFSVSPAVLVTEIDNTNTIGAISTSIGALVAGNLQWGQVDKIQQISSEDDLHSFFGGPTSTNYKDWFTAANFLQYSSNLQLIRVVEGTALNASAVITADAPAPGLGQLIKNGDDYLETVVTDFLVAKFPSVKGNNIRVVGAIPDDFKSNATTPKTFTLETDGVTSTPITVGSLFDTGALLADELALVVILNDGETNGTDTIVERMIVSTTFGAKNEAGQVYYFDKYLEQYSDWLYGNYSHVGASTFVWAIGDDFTLAGGNDGLAAVSAEYILGMDILAEATEVDISLLMTGGCDVVAGNYAVENVAEVRKDCLAFVSPQQSDVIGERDASAMITTKDAAFVPSSSYGSMDGNYKYMYDKYHDVYRWVPFNGDIAGLCALTDNTNDPWFSPAGFNRGRIRGVVKLAMQPSKAARDEMYKNNINPIASFPGDGVVLFGDKTLQAKSSAFQFINVRRLFIILEKSIATAAKYQLFEFNDSQTQATFRNMVEPFLRSVQGKRGVYDYRVVADASVNTPDVIDAGEFVAEIYIKPSRSIQVMNLSFIATKTGVSFDESAG
jgi:hypothetical protein